MKKSSKVILSFIGILFAGAFILSLLNFKDYLSGDKTLSHSSFNFFDVKNIKGDKILTSKTVTLSAFDRINIGSDFEATLNPGTENNVKITSDENILPYILIYSSVAAPLRINTHLRQRKH